MLRAANAAEAHAADAAAVASIIADALPSPEEAAALVRAPLPPPPTLSALAQVVEGNTSGRAAAAALAAAPPPLPPTPALPPPPPAHVLHGMPRQPVAYSAAGARLHTHCSLSGRLQQKRGSPADDGGDLLFWQRRRREAACDDAQDELQRCARESAAGIAFVEWWVADCAARVAAAARMRRHRERVAARIASERAKGKGLSRDARFAAQAAAKQRDDDERTAKQRLARASRAAQIAAVRERAAAAVAAARREIAARAAAAAARALAHLQSDVVQRAVKRAREGEEGGDGRVPARARREGDVTLCAAGCRG